MGVDQVEEHVGDPSGASLFRTVSIQPRPRNEVLWVDWLSRNAQVVGWERVDFYIGDSCDSLDKGFSLPVRVEHRRKITLFKIEDIIIVKVVERRETGHLFILV